MSNAATQRSTRLGRVWSVLWRRRIWKDVVQGVLIGTGVSILLTEIVVGIRVNSMMTTVNGWRSTQSCGVDSDRITLAACGQTLPAINTPEEAMYWQASVDATGAKLHGADDYVISFPAGELPPVHAFWSITIADARTRLMVANPEHKYSVTDRSGLVANADGSVDIYLQPTAPAGPKANWLPTPSGDFMLWLRAYEPEQSVLDRIWQPPAILKVKQ